MQNINNFDIAIIGAGLSGLRLAYSIQKKRPDLSIILLGPKDNRQQRISFWKHKGDRIECHDCIDARWESWNFKINSSSIHKSASNYEYVSLDGLTLKNKIENKLEKTQIFRDFDKLEIIDQAGEVSTKRLKVSTSNNKYYCNLLFDTRPPDPKPDCFIQQFMGQTLYSQSKHNVDTPTLMDFDVPRLSSTGIFFIYILPLDQYRLFVEFTGFLPEVSSTINFEEALGKVICEKFSNIKDPLVESSEIGSIPMGDVIPQISDKGIIPFGIAGGAARSSTGYAFLAVEKQIQSVLEHLGYSQFNPLANFELKNPYRKFSRWLDKVFLGVMSKNPELIPKTLIQLADGLTADQFAAFLSDHGGFFSTINAIRSVPTMPFVLSALGRK